MEGKEFIWDGRWNHRDRACVQMCVQAPVALSGCAVSTAAKSNPEPVPSTLADMHFFTVWFQSGPLRQIFIHGRVDFTELAEFCSTYRKTYSSVIINMIFSPSPPSFICSPGSRGVVPVSSAHCCSSPCWWWPFTPACHASLITSTTRLTC